jgi:hypothetical protein
MYSRPVHIDLPSGDPILVSKYYASQVGGKEDWEQSYDRQIGVKSCQCADHASNMPQA